MTALTSLLATLSGAYVKIPPSPDHAGFSAGGFKDMNRVTRLNE